MGKLIRLLAGCSGILLVGCVTKTINSDGTVQSNVIDKNKLSDTYINLALEYQNHNAPQVALDRVNLALTTLPSNPRAYMVRAMIYAQLNKPENAEADFKQAIDLKDDYADAYVNYAVFLCNQRRYPEAMADFATALNNPLYFTPEMGYYSRGNCYYAQANYESANADYLKALTYNNAPPDTYIALAQVQYHYQNYQVANYYINKYSGSQTPATMWLHIQILQGLLDHSHDRLHEREYSGYRNTLGQLLIQNYGDTYEAQQYLLRYGSANAKAAAAARVAAVVAPSASVAPVVVVKSAAASTAQTKTQTKQTTTKSTNDIYSDSTGRRYIVVQPGETLYHISKTYGVAISRLTQINHLGAAGPKSGLRLYLDPK